VILRPHARRLLISRRATTPRQLQVPAMLDKLMTILVIPRSPAIDLLMRELR
jgi:hypothetical protein